MIVVALINFDLLGLAYIASSSFTQLLLVTSSLSVHRAHKELLVTKEMLEQLVLRYDEL